MSDHEIMDAATAAEHNHTHEHHILIHIHTHIHRNTPRLSLTA